jgi:hypothetical protein
MDAMATKASGNQMARLGTNINRGHYQGNGIVSKANSGNPSKGDFERVARRRFSEPQADAARGVVDSSGLEDHLYQWPVKADARAHKAGSSHHGRT